ncbi:MAG: PorV/PorQ family protein [candidate division WOR-3 bacterium]|nr:PorV/PorQ family protein [candidate division WOR-3 bacterium]MCX7757806.1 PorV/PorQ family protein [candidate division WOR-3 bacterium]MDW7987203.1 PorV/PorQ family protein [candidate division WOR-3 bacterium]
MNRKQTGLIFLLLFVLNINISQAVFTKLGKAGFAFLKIGVGRATGMGEAFVAVANDVSATYYNPAGLALIKNKEFLLSHNEWILSSRLEYLAFAHPTNFGTLGIALTYLNYGEFEETTIDNYQGTGRTFSANDMALTLGLARMFTDKFAFGGNVKVIQERIWDLTANAVALDLGIYYNTGWRNLRLAMTISNFGPDARFSGKQLDVTITKPENWTWPWTISPIPATYKTENFILPTIFRVGLAYDFIRHENYLFTIATDLVHYNDLNERINVGLELNFKRYYLLAGASVNTDFEYASWVLWRSSLCGGFGAAFNIFGNTILNLDYIVRDLGRLGLAHRVNLKLGL